MEAWDPTTGGQRIGGTDESRTISSIRDNLVRWWVSSIPLVGPTAPIYYVKAAAPPQLAPLLNVRAQLPFYLLIE